MVVGGPAKPSKTESSTGLTWSSGLGSSGRLWEAAGCMYGWACIWVEELLAFVSGRAYDRALGPSGTAT